MSPKQLVEFRRRHGVTQVEMARAIGTTQSGVSRIERSDDINLSTARKYLAHLGYVLGVVAVADLSDGTPVQIVESEVLRLRLEEVVEERDFLRMVVDRLTKRDAADE